MPAAWWYGPDDASENACKIKKNIFRWNTIFGFRILYLDPSIISKLPGSADTWINGDADMQKILPATYVRLGGTNADVDEGLGPLAAFEGKWVGSKGWNIIAMPSPGSVPTDVGKFVLEVRPYMETWEFKALGAPVRNRGGAVDQFVGALEYTQSVTALDGEQEVLHEENGMMMYLGVVKPNESTDPLPTPPFPIARSGTIPHGNSIMLLGDHMSVDGPPDISPISTLPPNVGDAPVLGYTDPYMTLNQELPVDVINPNATLLADIAQQKILKTETFTLESANQGHIANIPFIREFADCVRMKSTFWIETVQVPGSEQTFQQMQYTQIIDLDFHKQFSRPSEQTELIRWPHVTINTMKKQ